MRSWRGALHPATALLDSDLRSKFVLVPARVEALGFRGYARYVVHTLLQSVKLSLLCRAHVVHTLFTRCSHSAAECEAFSTPLLGCIYMYICIYI